MVRASWAKTLVGAAKRIEIPSREVALRAIPDDVRADIRSKGKLGWIAAEQMAVLMSGIERGFGADASTVWVDAMRLAVQSPLLRPLQMGAFSLFGNDPLKIVKMSPRVWELLTRDCGTFECHASGAGARLTMRSLPSALRSCPAFVAGIAGAGEAMISLCGAVPRSQSCIDELERGEAHVDVAWATG